MDTIVIVGVLARVSDARRKAVGEELEAMPNVDTFAVEGAGRIGILIEARSLDEAHAFLREHIDSIDGVLGTWPVSAEFDGAFDSELRVDRPAADAASASSSSPTSA